MHNTHTHTHTHTYIYIYIYIHIHTYLRTYLQVRPSGKFVTNDVTLLQVGIGQPWFKISVKNWDISVVTLTPMVTQFKAGVVSDQTVRDMDVKK